MNTYLFLQTMLEVLKHDNKFKDKQTLMLPILRRAKINNIPQYEFVRCGQSGQRYENIEIRVPIPLINNANEILEDLRSLVRYVYEESSAHDLGEVLIRPLILQDEEFEHKEHDVMFSDIQDTIIQGIRDAKYVIWGAVAWLTNQVIIDELLAKKQQRIDVRLIISEETNNCPYYKQLSENFDTVLIPHHGWEEWNRMHDKFCIIDFEYVMHGSYNWTKVANYNDETLATALDRDFVKKFADEFMCLYRKGHKIETD